MYGAHGRPEICPSQNPRHVSFNLSHSGERALLAVAMGTSVGVDLETMRPGGLRPGGAIERIAHRFLTEAERSALPSSGDERDRALYAAWVCKEAYLKRLGTGFSRAPTRFEVVRQEADGNIFGVRDAGAEHVVVRVLLPFPDASHYIAAVAAEGRDWRLAVCDDLDTHF